MEAANANDTKTPGIPENVLRRLMHSAGMRMAVQKNGQHALALATEDLDTILKTAVLSVYSRGATRLNLKAVEFSMRVNDVALLDAGGAKRAKSGKAKAARQEKEDGAESEDEEESLSDDTEEDAASAAQARDAAEDDLGWD